MVFYLALTLATVAVGALTYFVWKTRRLPGFVLGMALVYYFSLMGGWVIISDETSGVYKGYQYLYNKLFFVLLDDYYLFTLIFYGLFLLMLSTTVWLVTKPYQKTETSDNRLYIRHKVILLVGFAAISASYFLIHEYLYEVILLSRSIYVSRMEWQSAIPYYTLAAELMVVAYIACMLGLAVLMSGKNARMLVGVEGRWVWLGYLVLLGILILQSFIFGNRGVLFVHSLAFALLFLANSGRSRRANWVLLGSIMTVVVLTLSATTVLRGVPLGQLTPETFAQELYLVPTEGHYDDWFVNRLFFTAERITAHLSLYGALAFDVPLTYGSSFISLGASFIPRVLWPDRPDDIYYYYAEQVGATMDQGYTIHHATGWYLNFGVLGILLGAVVLGLVWGGLYNLHQRWARCQSRFVALVGILAPWLLLGNFPALLRSGIEGYKAVLFDVVLIPAVLFWAALTVKPKSRPVPAAPSPTQLSLARPPAAVWPRPSAS